MTYLHDTTAQFFNDDSGAVTVDWVVLTAALVGLGLATMAVVSGGVEDLSGDMDTQLVSQEIVTEFGSSVFGITNDQIVSWHHGDTWLDSTVSAWSDPSQISDADLIAHYNSVAATVIAQNPGDITSGHYHNAIDHMGAAEEAMRQRGIPIPEAGINYQTAYNNYQGT